MLFLTQIAEGVLRTGLTRSLRVIASSVVVNDNAYFDRNLPTSVHFLALYNCLICVIPSPIDHRDVDELSAGHLVLFCNLATFEAPSKELGSD